MLSGFAEVVQGLADDGAEGGQDGRVQGFEVLTQSLQSAAGGAFGQVDDEGAVFELRRQALALGDQDGGMLFGCGGEVARDADGCVDDADVAFGGRAGVDDAFEHFRDGGLAAAGGAIDHEDGARGVGAHGGGEPGEGVGPGFVIVDGEE